MDRATIIRDGESSFNRCLQLGNSILGRAKVDESQSFSLGERALVKALQELINGLHSGGNVANERLKSVEEKLDELLARTRSPRRADVNS